MLKFSVFFLSLLTILYFLVLGSTAIALVAQDAPVGKAMGIALFLLPAVGLFSIIAELRFGVKSEKLAKQVQAEGSWPVVATETLPSGRAVKASALQLFESFKNAVDQDETSWRAWFNLAMSYDACGDRKRARQALRKAIALHETAA